MELKTIREAVGKDNGINAHSRSLNVLKRYMSFWKYERILDKNGRFSDYKKIEADISKDLKCVVAYRRNSLGCIFIIKGNKYFSFIHLNKSNSFNTFRIDNQEAIKFINDKTNEVWLKPSHLQKIEAIEMVNKLK